VCRVSFVHWIAETLIWETAMKFRLVAILMLVMAGPCFGGDEPLPVQQVAEACMPCQAKCPKCLSTGRFTSVAECKADCNMRGNPSVVAACGVFKRCGQ
jgi:hypothetical protein